VDEKPVCARCQTSLETDGSEMPQPVAFVTISGETLCDGCWVVEPDWNKP
jgi:hypothetical protein